VKTVARGGILGRRVSRIVDEICVVAGPADHDVGAAAAVDEIVPAIAPDGVRQVVAVALQVGAAEQGQVLHVRREPEVDEREHRVGALAWVLDHHVPGIVDEIAVVAGATGHGIGAEPAGEHVGLGVSDQDVVEIGARQILDGAVGVADGIQAGIGCSVAEIGSDCAQCIVVEHRVRSGAAIEDVTAGAADEEVVARETIEGIGSVEDQRESRPVSGSYRVGQSDQANAGDAGHRFEDGGPAAAGTVDLGDGATGRTC
jgi:hypothetical protein